MRFASQVACTAFVLAHVGCGENTEEYRQGNVRPIDGKAVVKENAEKGAVSFVSSAPLVSCQIKYPIPASGLAAENIETPQLMLAKEAIMSPPDRGLPQLPVVIVQPADGVLPSAFGDVWILDLVAQDAAMRVEGLVGESLALDCEGARITGALFFRPIETVEELTQDGSTLAELESIVVNIPALAPLVYLYWIVSYQRPLVDRGD
jgi:hypothetical protein